MNTIVLHVCATELNDVLCFNRLKADIRKIAQSSRLVIVHSSLSMQPETEIAKQIAALTTFNKTFAAKLSEELLPAVALAAHHLGIITLGNPSNKTDLISSPKALMSILQQGGIPVIAPIVRETSGAERVVQSQEVAAKVAAAIQADLLIFLIEPKEVIQDEVKRQVMPENKYAVESLRAGTKRAFLTDMGGMEQVLLHHKAAPVEVFDNNQ